MKPHTTFNTPPTHGIHCPGQFFQNVNHKVSQGEIIDAASILTSHARGVVGLLGLNTSGDADNEYVLNPHLVESAVAGIAGMLDQLQGILDHQNPEGEK